MNNKIREQIAELQKLEQLKKITELENRIKLYEYKIKLNEVNKLNEKVCNALTFCKKNPRLMKDAVKVVEKGKKTTCKTSLLMGQGDAVILKENAVLFMELIKLQENNTINFEDVYNCIEKIISNYEKAKLDCDNLEDKLQMIYAILENLKQLIPYNNDDATLSLLNVSENLCTTFGAFSSTPNKVPNKSSEDHLG